MDFINDFNAHDLLTLIDSVKLKLSNMEYKDILDEITKIHKNGEKMKSKCITLNEELKRIEDREIKYLQEIKEFLVNESILNQHNSYLRNEVAILNDKLENVKHYLSVSNIGFQLKELYSELNNSFVILNEKKEYASHFYKTMNRELEEPYWRIKLVSEKMFKMIESLKFNEKDKKIEKYFNASILKNINDLIEKDILYRIPIYNQMDRREPLTTHLINESLRTSNYRYSDNLVNRNLDNTINPNGNDNDTDHNNNTDQNNNNTIGPDNSDEPLENTNNVNSINNNNRSNNLNNLRNILPGRMSTEI